MEQTGEPVVHVYVLQLQVYLYLIKYLNIEAPMLALKQLDEKLPEKSSTKAADLLCHLSRYIDLQQPNLLGVHCCI